MRDMRDWTPKQHVDQACIYAEKIEMRLTSRTQYVMTPVHLTLASLHCEIATLKIAMGGEVNEGSGDPLVVRLGTHRPDTSGD